MPWGKLWRRGSDLWFSWWGVHLSLAVKLLAPVLVTTAGLAAGLGYLIAGNVQYHIESQYDREAATLATGIEAIYLQRPDDISLLNDYLLKLRSGQSDVVSARIVGLDAETTVIASDTPGEVGLRGLPDANEKAAVWGGYALTDRDDGGNLVIIRPLENSELRFGAVMLTSSKTREEAAVREVGYAIAAAALVAILIESLFASSTIYFGILRRTRRMMRAVEAVGRGDTSIRLPEGQEPRGRDQIFNLARSLDAMILSLDERQRGEALIRKLGQCALEGMAPAALMVEALSATRQALALESCIFVKVNDEGVMVTWLDEAGMEHGVEELPSWVYALSHVAVERRKAVISDRLGQQSCFAEAPTTTSSVQAVIVPLPGSSRAGPAIVAIAPSGETIPDGGLAVLDAVAATMSESLHMHAAETARAESAVKSKVMAAVSHEMRNPLNSILGFTGLLLGGPPESLTAKQRRQLGFVQSSATNMLNLVNNYLDLAKLRAGSMSLQYETVKLSPLVAEIVAAMQPIAEARRVTIRASVAAGAEARVDLTRTRQILTNLVSNAVKFTPEGGRVFVRARVDDRLCRLVVSDTGVGIEKDQQHLVFTEFARIEANGMAASKGTGLGLSLTKAFVEAMRGSIKFYSRRGRGTTFVVELPRDGLSSERSNAA